jgi:hypothetical protein
VRKALADAEQRSGPERRTSLSALAARVNGENGAKSGSRVGMLAKTIAELATSQS